MSVKRGWAPLYFFGLNFALRILLAALIVSMTITAITSSKTCGSISTLCLHMNHSRDIIPFFHRQSRGAFTSVGVRRLRGNINIGTTSVSTSSKSTLKLTHTSTISPGLLTQTTCVRRINTVKTNLRLFPKNVDAGGIINTRMYNDSSRNKKISMISMLSSVAAVSVTNSTLNGKDEDSDATNCAAGNDEGKGNSVEPKLFPEDALFYDTYNGVTIYMDKLPTEYISPADNAQKFLSVLEESIQVWKLKGKKGIWIHIPNDCSIVVPKCTELGFEFRHANTGHLVMTRWLPDDQPSRLPCGPTHQLGVGVVIIHPITKKMLVVQEKTGPAAARKLWKMPTGLTDPGEDIADAAVRETKEETGLECTFDKILCMRQAHGGTFRQSDLFIVCQLKLSSKYDEELKRTNDIKLKPQEEEIAGIEWMDVDEFAGQELWQSSPLYKQLNQCIHLAVKSCCNGGGDENSHEPNYGLIAKTLPLGYRSGDQTVYLSSSL